MGQAFERFLDKYAIKDTDLFAHATFGIIERNPEAYIFSLDPKATSVEDLNNYPDFLNEVYTYTGLGLSDLKQSIEDTLVRLNGDNKLELEYLTLVDKYPDGAYKVLMIETEMVGF